MNAAVLQQALNTAEAAATARDAAAALRAQLAPLRVVVGALGHRART